MPHNARSSSGCLTGDEIDDYLLGRSVNAVGVEAHLSVCEHCRRDAECTEMLIAALGMCAPRIRTPDEHIQTNRADSCWPTARQHQSHG